MNLQSVARVLGKDNGLWLRGIILRQAEKGQVIHGAMATNVQLPSYLRAKTKDYDIFTPKPKKSAVAMVKKLNRAIGEERYEVIKGQHKGTYKVKTKEGKTIIDYTQLKRKPKTKDIYGNEYYDIKTIKRNVKRLIKKPETEYRREKDVGTLERIRRLEEIESMF